MVRRCNKFLTTLQGQVANTWLTELTSVNKDFTLVLPKQPAPDRLTLRINQGPDIKWVLNLRPCLLNSRFFMLIHISTLPCVTLPPWQLSLAEHIKGGYQVQHAGGKHWVHCTRACVGGGGRQEGTVNRGKSWTGGPFWNDMVGSKPHKILKPFKTKCAPETMLAFPRVFLEDSWGGLEGFLYINAILNGPI